MIAALLGAAHRLDEAVSRKLGRPYHAVLGIGLVIEIVRRIREAGDLPDFDQGVVRAGLAVLLFAVLLVHQLGELGDRLDARRERQK